MMRVLALDLGVQCGRAWTDDGEVHVRQSGTWKLDSKQDGKLIEPRFGRLAHWIEQMNPDLIVYERVDMPHRSTQAAKMYEGLVATVLEYARGNGVQVESISVEQIKIHATGQRAANKNLMFWTAQDRFDPTHQYLADERKHNHQADALHVLDCYLHGGLGHVKVASDGDGKEAA